MGKRIATNFFCNRCRKEWIGFYNNSLGSWMALSFKEDKNAKCPRCKSKDVVAGDSSYAD